MAEYLTVQAVARRWACSAETVRRLCKSGALPSFALVGSDRRVSFAAVEAYEAARSTQPAAPEVQPAPRARRPQAANGGAITSIEDWRAEIDAIAREAIGRTRGAGKKKARSAAN